VMCTIKTEKDERI